MLREALQRHPDVFLEVISNLQNQALDNKANMSVEPVEEQEEVVVTVVGI